ncbi:MAG: hypothetical protein N2561_06860 [Bacteroidetes bacterium]|nr:hypothetical protein [Rhodothermia bacterium]MCS7154956.1 hypothetical protein [Bacteroidota bacterium]MCX7907240.1 hypothetical protein [Bacteroidota bacterium]MDW8138034.1 hypothetical protein [Bacteroidota bacterium]MDW8286114.1 hypothetical protein [Bacteroidota bacterium]
MRRIIGAGLCALVAFSCDHGISPPPPPEYGAIRGSVRVRSPWPPRDSVRDLRFVAFRILPRDTADFLNLNNFIYSPSLLSYFGADSFAFFVDSVPAGLYLYSGIAQRFGPGLLDWRPVGLYADDPAAPKAFRVEGGLVRRDIQITVDFYRRPPFPPR